MWTATRKLLNTAITNLFNTKIKNILKDMEEKANNIKILDKKLEFVSLELHEYKGTNEL